MFEEIEARKGLNDRAIAAKLAKIEELREDVKLLRLENDSFPVAKTRRAKKAAVTVEGMTAVLTALDASLRADGGKEVQTTMPMYAATITGVDHGRSEFSTETIQDANGNIIAQTRVIRDDI